MKKRTETRIYGMRMLAMALLICISVGLLCGMVSATTGAESASVLKDHGIYTVAYAEDYSPYSYTDSDGNPAGMVIDIMNYIAQNAGFQISYVTVGEVNRYRISADINLAILTVDQLEGISVKSLPFTSLQMMAVADNVPLVTQGAKVGHLSYYYLDDGAVEAALPGCMAHTYFSYGEMVQDYLVGDLDYMLVSSLVSNQMLDSAYRVDSYTVPTAVNLDFFLSYADTMPQEEMAAFDAVIRNLDADYIYSSMLSSVIVATNEEITLSEVVDVYGAPIQMFLVLVLATIGIIIYLFNRSKHKALEQALYVDELTGLMTQRKFIADVGKRLETAKPGEFYLISIDIDRFKFINELYGYDVGSKVIVRFGTVIKELFPEDSVISRVFADNFVILYQSLDEEFHARSTREYEDSVDKAMANLLGEDYRLTTSSGIYRIENPSLPLSYMVDCANVARIRGKTGYGISKMEFTDGLEQRIRQMNDIVRTMERAITNREFQVYYQPKICLKGKQQVGAEALVRWVRADGSRLAPDAFIPLFESNGFIVKVDYYVLDAVCEFLASNPHIHKVSVNFSGLTMLSDGMLERVQAIIQTHGIDASRVEIEITEGAVVRNFEPMVELTAKLKNLGFTVSMDDFGAGISSLNRLKDLDIDVLKIDRAFLGERILSQRGISIIEHIICMARELGISTIAEGVEYCQQVDLLQALGCDMVQGYFYARPMPEEEYLTYISDYIPNQSTETDE